VTKHGRARRSNLGRKEGRKRERKKERLAMVLNPAVVEDKEQHVKFKSPTDARLTDTPLSAWGLHKKRLLEDM